MKIANSARRAFAAVGRLLRLFIHSLLLVLVVAATAGAHDDGRPLALRAVDFQQKLGEQAPLDTEFFDETGKTVMLGDYFGTRPVILTFAYYRCQDLCPLLLDGVLRTLRALSFSAGKEFEVVNISFDPHDTPALAEAKKSDLIRRYARAGAADGWHFLSGGESSIKRVTEAAGFRYNYEKDNDRFAHATGIMLLTPEGRFARYLYGIEFSPRDLRLGLLEASDGKIGKAIDQLLLFCYHYDPAMGKYSLMVTNLVRGATIATVLALGAFITLSLRRELSRRAE